MTPVPQPPEQQLQQALSLLRMALAAIKGLKTKHSVTSVELEIEDFLNSVADDDIFGLSS
jgi:hypothetical protein